MSTTETAVAAIWNSGIGRSGVRLRPYMQQFHNRFGPGSAKIQDAADSIRTAAGGSEVKVCPHLVTA